MIKEHTNSLPQKMKQELISKVSNIANGLISEDELENLYDNLSNICQRYADELLDNYYAKIYHNKPNSYSNFNQQSHCINIFIPMNFQPVQTPITPLNQIAPMQNPYNLINLPYQTSPNPQYQTFANQSNLMGQPFIPVNQSYQIYPPIFNQNTNTSKRSSKNSNKEKGKKSDSKHKKKESHHSKKGNKSDSNQKHISKSKSNSSKSQAENDANANIKTFIYRSDDQFNGIISSFPRLTRDKDILVDSSSKFVPGFGYPRNVFPGGSYFKGANDDNDFWVRFDFQKNLIEISSYTIYSDNIKNWNLEISNDGSDWEIIDRHSDYLNKPVKTNFEVQKKRFVRYCRIHQTGSCSGSGTVKINTIEFFGRIKIIK